MAKKRKSKRIPPAVSSAARGLAKWRHKGKRKRK